MCYFQYGPIRYAARIDFIRLGSISSASKPSRILKTLVKSALVAASAATERLPMRHKSSSTASLPVLLSSSRTKRGLRAGLVPVAQAAAGATPPATDMNFSLSGRTEGAPSARRAGMLRDWGNLHGLHLTDGYSRREPRNRAKQMQLRSLAGTLRVCWGSVRRNAPRGENEERGTGAARGAS